ncbi:MAG: hypothetical protein V1736_12385 [Pseudomonadota bacterium]
MKPIRVGQPILSVNGERRTLNVFDRSRLEIKPLSERRHDLDLSKVLPLNPSPAIDPAFQTVAGRIVDARARDSSIVLMMGAHVLRSGVQNYLIDLMEKGYLTCIAMNGAGVIHDYELALIGATTESVAHYIKDGHFGLWRETGRINDIVTDAAGKGKGLGESVGKVIEEERFPNRSTSILAAGYRLGIPVTVHVGIGCDIVHEFPNCDGAAYGATSYSDFLRFAGVMESLEGGVVMNFGSSVMAPEVYLKALAMVRNIARQENRQIVHFTTLVCDLVDLPARYREEPSRDTPYYYFRPWKTMLVRTVADGGESYYVKGWHRDTIPQLWTGIMEAEAA